MKNIIVIVIINIIMACMVHHNNKENIHRIFLDNRYQDYDMDMLKNNTIHKIKISFPIHIKQKIKSIFNFELNDSYSSNCRSYKLNQITPLIDMTTMKTSDVGNNKHLYTCMCHIMGTTKELMEAFNNEEKLDMNMNCIIHRFQHYTIIESTQMSVLISQDFILIFDKNMSKFVSINQKKMFFYRDNIAYRFNINDISDDMVNGNAVINDGDMVNYIQFTSNDMKQQYFNIFINQTTKKIIKEIICIENTGVVLKNTQDGNTNTTYYENGGVEKLFVKCMMSNGNKPQIGKYTMIKKSDGTSNIKLEIDNIILYKKNDNKVLVDLITPPIKKDDYIIGWKAVKSFNDEIRIVKLGIPYDTQRVIPIGSDFFSTFRKERCNRALVLDIQLPNLDEIISVVPNEKVARSYMYENITEYKVGCIVEPDGFNNNPSESCGQGIHYHRDRRAVFKMWIKGYEDIKYEY